jgi:glycosyltransferase involved in cell wall biosynthesis
MQVWHAIWNQKTDNMSKVIVHIAETNINKESGMGRVAWNWRAEIERRGHKFIHIGPSEIGAIRHKAFFAKAAYRTYQRLGLRADLFLVHEPFAPPFLKLAPPTVLFSHGVERRAWELKDAMTNSGSSDVSFKTRLLFPLWRLHGCDSGLRKANRLLLINQQDAEFVRKKYGRLSSDILVFKNGIDHFAAKPHQPEKSESPRVLFLGTWIARKGTKTVVEAAKILANRNVPARWIFAGTGVEPSAILQMFPEDLHGSIEIIKKFSADQEVDIFNKSTLFMLPSFFEGQPLALLQAMAAGFCCITTDCCGQRDVIAHRQNGLLHQPGDSIKLAELIEEALSNDELRNLMGQNARDSVEGRDWQLVSSEVVDFIEQSIEVSSAR